jgi:hypothetical protein
MEVDQCKIAKWKQQRPISRQESHCGFNIPAARVLDKCVETAQFVSSSTVNGITSKFKEELDYHNNFKCNYSKVTVCVAAAAHETTIYLLYTPHLPLGFWVCRCGQVIGLQPTCLPDIHTVWLAADMKATSNFTSSLASFGLPCLR